MKYHLELSVLVNKQFLVKLKKVHVVTGTILFIFGKVEIIIGLRSTGNTTYLILGIIWMVLLLLIRLVLEIWRYKY